jgi:hypothetical protein
MESNQPCAYFQKAVSVVIAIGVDLSQYRLIMDNASANGRQLRYVKDNQHPQRGYEVKQLPVSIGPNDSLHATTTAIT